MKKYEPPFFDSMFYFDPPKKRKAVKHDIADITNEEMDGIVLSLVAGGTSTFAEMLLAIKEAFWGGTCKWDRKIDRALQRLRRHGMIIFRGDINMGWTQL